MTWADVMLLAVLGMVGFVMLVMALFGVVLVVLNTRATLTSRWRCHGSWAHARWAHRRDGRWRFARALGFGVPSLWRGALDFPPRQPGGRRRWQDRRAVRRGVRR